MLGQSPPNQIQNNHGALPLFILTLIQQKHKAKLAWQNQRNPAAKKMLNKITKKVQTDLKQFRVHSYNKFLSNIHQNDSSLYKKSIKPRDKLHFFSSHSDSSHRIWRGKKQHFFRKPFEYFLPKPICTQLEWPQDWRCSEITKLLGTKFNQFCYSRRNKTIIKKLPNKKISWSRQHHESYVQKTSY